MRWQRVSPVLVQMRQGVSPVLVQVRAAGTRCKASREAQRVNDSNKATAMGRERHALPPRAPKALGAPRTRRAAGYDGPCGYCEYQGDPYGYCEYQGDPYGYCEYQGLRVLRVPRELGFIGGSAAGPARCRRCDSPPGASPRRRRRDALNPKKTNTRMQWDVG